MRFLLRVIGAIVVFGLIVLAGLFFVPSEQVAKVAAKQISDFTGREVTVSGDVSLSLYPILGVKTGAVSIANADWSDQGPMLTADGLSIGVDAMKLVGGDIAITHIQATNPVVVLEKSAKGVGNWEIGDGAEGGTSAADPRKVTLAKASVTRARVKYLDHSAGVTNSFNDIDLTLDWPNPAGPAKIDARYGAISASGSVADLPAFIAGKVAGLAGTARLPGGTLSFDGRAATSPQATGALRVDFSDTAKALAALGIKGVDMPRGFGASAAGSANVTYTDGTLALRGLDLSTPPHHFAGDVDLILTGAKPIVAARLSASALDLTAFMGTGGGGQGWSRAAIDASAVGLIDGKIELTTPAVDLGDYKLGKTRITTVIDRARAVTSIHELAVFGGQIGGEFVVNNRNGLSVGGNLALSGIDSLTALKSLADLDKLGGMADIAIKFLGIGQSMDQIMRSLSGDGRFVLHSGTINGVDLEAMLATGQGRGGNTKLDKMQASFVMKDGVLLNADLEAAVNRVVAHGEGQVNIGAQSLDYLLVPVATKAFDGQGLAVPVRLKGPWSNIKVTPDLSAAIDLNLQAEQERLEKELQEKLKAEEEKLRQRAEEEQRKLEERARAEAKRLEEQAKQELNKKLDIEVQDGQSLEDAVRNKLENEINKGLLDLLKQ